MRSWEGLTPGGTGPVHLREGKLRSTGSFSHPILAGSYGAMVLPMFVGWWWKDRKSRTQAALGVAAATIIVLAANSSTCLLGFMGGLLALFLWPLRNRMRPIRWGIALTLVALHMVMKAPVWQLISRVSSPGARPRTIAISRKSMHPPLLRLGGHWH